MRRVISSAIVGLAGLVLAVAAPRHAEAGPITYIALGDSIAFGETDFMHNPSYGDRGYVSKVADTWAAQNGGIRPKVVNLAIDGETTSSFLSGGQAATPLNLNYANTATSQNTALITALGAEKAAGHTVGEISLSLGANDLYAVVNQPGFFSQNPAQQQSAILGAMTAVQNNYTAILTEIHALAPDAQVTLVGYYNPYAAVPGSPISKLSGPAIQLLNAVIAGEASAFGAKFVDTYTPFLGHEGDYTYVFASNPHPNDIGYGVIATQIAPVPEPTTMALIGVLGLGLARRSYRRNRAA